MNFNYLSLEEVLRIHFRLIEDFGGSHGIHNEGRLKSVVDAPKSEAFGVELYPSVFEKAAVYMRNINGDHPFRDGNKRTAVTTCGIFLMRNGIKLIASPIELEAFATKVATDHIEIPEIAEWLKNHSVEK